MGQAHRATGMQNFVLLVYVICAFLLFGCKREPITVGFVAGLTGRHSELGVSGRNGVLLAFESINANGGINGRPLVLQVADDETDPQRTEQIMRDMYAKGVQFFIGPMISRSAPGVMAAINDLDILVFSPTISASYYYGRKDYLVLANASAKESGGVLAKKIASRGFDSVWAVLDMQNPTYTTDVLQGLLEGAPAITWIKDSLHLGLGLSPEAVASNIMKDKGQAVVLITSGADAATIAQALQKHGYTIPLFGTAWTQTPDLLEQGGRAVEGMLILSTLHDNVSEQTLQFSGKYQKKFGSHTSFASEMGYEAAINLAMAMQRSGLNPRAVQEDLLSQPRLKGLRNSWQLDEYGDPQRGFYLVKIRDGHFIPVAEEP